MHPTQYHRFETNDLGNLERIHPVDDFHPQYLHQSLVRNLIRARLVLSIPNNNQFINPRPMIIPPPAVLHKLPRLDLLLENDRFQQHRLRFVAEHGNEGKAAKLGIVVRSFAEGEWIGRLD